MNQTKMFNKVSQHKTVVYGVAGVVLAMCSGFLAMKRGRQIMEGIRSTAQTAGGRINDKLNKHPISRN